MNGKSKEVLPIILLVFLLSVIACELPIVPTYTPQTIPTWTPSTIASPFPSKTATVDFQTQAVFRATLWATEHPLPTSPPGYPTPQPPLPAQAVPDKPYSYSNQTLFFGNYIVHRWTNHFDPLYTQTITISAVGQAQKEVKHSLIHISELSGVDITGDGGPELILYGNDGGNQCGHWVYIFSLAKELKAIINRAVKCRDYFKDLNNDGIYEYVTTSPLPSSLSPLYRTFEAITVWEYDPNLGYINASSKYQSLYAGTISSAQSEIDQLISTGASPDDYVYYLAMNYFYSGQPDNAWAVLEKYLDAETAFSAGQTLLESRDHSQVQHPRP